MKTAEFLSCDILEEVHLKSFAPFRFIQMILGSCRVDARDKFVTAPTKLQKLYTIILFLITIPFYINIIMNYLVRFSEYHSIYYICIMLLSIHFSTYAANIFHVRFMNNGNNVQFYIKTQEIDRKMKIDKNKFINLLLYKANLTTVVFVFVILVMLFTASITEDKKILASFVGLLYGQLTCTLEWLYCSNIVIFFYIRLRYINAIMINHLKGLTDINIESVDNLILPTKKVLRFLASDVHDFKYSETDVYLQDIFEELFRFQNLYRFQIFLFSFKFVPFTLLAFEFGVLAMQNNVLQWLETIVLPTVTLIDLTIIIVLSIRCESFSREIKETKYLCTTILSQYQEGPLRRKAIKMLKMIKEKPPQFSVYDMWHMDASTLIHMINLVTTLIVTLLQFAFL